MNIEALTLAEVVDTYFSMTFEDSLKEEIKEHGQIEQLKAGDFIIDIGEPMKGIPILVSGTLKIMRETEEGREMLLYYLEEGDACSMSMTCCMTTQQSMVRAMAEEDATIIMIPVSFMDEWMHKYSSWRAYVMNGYTRRFEELLEVVDDVAFRKMDERLVNYLVQATEVKNNRELHLSHMEIATDLGTSREVVSRLLKQLEKKGVITMGRNKLTLAKDWDKFL
ncbi:Crp/Fnr family transcriptional regulator [Algivirga pacifica]|uniref:Crp/Fnr family transcriptional regulator n=1 Tax=Algivirga pacifica TaxID=1162670 RepID=A0ABP9D8K7_9BACT